MLKRMTLQERFVAWLDTKNPDERYPWTDRCNCACGQFLRDSGIEDHTPEAQEVWSAFNSIAGAFGTHAENVEYGLDASKWTFGKLRDRVLAEAAAN